MSEGLLTDQWLKKLSHYKRLFVGFSGGMDSTVLLHALASQTSLQKKLYAVHVNHHLSSNASFWQTQCQEFCKQMSIPLITCDAIFKRQGNIEERARNARYQLFTTLLEKKDALILAHHSNDQAETLLLHLFRGAGVDGLSSMPEKKPLGQGTVLRPLLTKERQELASYAKQYDLSWTDDESNSDVHFSRNFLREVIIPQLQTRWPGVVANLNRTAKHCQQAKENLESLAFKDCPDILSPQLPLALIKTLNRARLSNVLRIWLKNNNVLLPSTSVFNRLIDECIHAREDATPLISWDDVQIKRYQHCLHLVKKYEKKVLKPVVWTNFPQDLFVDELGLLSAVAVNKGIKINAQQKIEIRFRQGGEKMRLHGQTKPLKKLFQEWEVPPWQRHTIPLIFLDDHLAAVVDNAISDDYFGKENAYQITIKSE